MWKNIKEIYFIKHLKFQLIRVGNYRKMINNLFVVKSTRGNRKKQHCNKLLEKYKY